MIETKERMGTRKTIGREDQQGGTQRGGGRGEHGMEGMDKQGMGGGLQWPVTIDCHNLPVLTSVCWNCRYRSPSLACV